MFSKFEFVGAGLSIAIMAVALYMIQVQTTFTPEKLQSATAVESARPEIIMVGSATDVTQARTEAFEEALDKQGKLNSMVIDEIKVGVGEEVKEGDVVAVHYIGTLQNGQEFDNSRKRGQPFEFKVGAGQVIQGWDKGLVGMKVGGQRVLVIPPDMAYGKDGIGPIPGNATLVFAIELIEIK
jgi:FKBP-type peptidyl-prolyl cis-trans isomerase